MMSSHPSSGTTDSVVLVVAVLGAVFVAVVFVVVVFDEVFADVDVVLDEVFDVSVAVSSARELSSGPHPRLKAVCWAKTKDRWFRLLILKSVR